MKEKLLGMTLAELKTAAQACGLKPFVGAQLADWLYAKRARSWDRMANISKAAREALAVDGDTAGPELRFFWLELWDALVNRLH